MSRRRDPARVVPSAVRAAIEREFESPALMLSLASQSLAYSCYDSEFFNALLRTARGEAGESWSVRCFALALLERQLAMLNPGELSEFDRALVRLGLKNLESDLVNPALVGSTVDIALDELVPQLLRKINRRRTGRGKKNRERELADLLHRSTQECKLTLAACVFSPEEVMQRVLAQVTCSEGVCLSGFAKAEGKSALAEGSFHLHSYERKIANEVQRNGQVYWVNHSTSAQINSLVEYPLGTVALVVKLPGGDTELEFKRAGKRERPLGVLFENCGTPAPVSHRLQGGSTGWMLQAESDNESRFRSLFRAIHQDDPPLSRTLFITNIRRLPCKSGNSDLLTWFTDAETFGPGYTEMRLAMKRCLEAGGGSVPESALAQTVAFLRDAKPRQSVLAGTSSFRLDRLSEYLSSSGAKRYFDDGLKVPWTRSKAQQFADDLLEEVLGTYVEPNISYRTHGQYVQAALTVPENRSTANKNYLFCMEQIGTVWGTMLAIGSYSIGESFVPRNVGLKAVWQESSWKVQIIFMDHDCLQSAGPDQTDFRAAETVAGTIHDETHIFGHALPHRANIGAVTCLEEIYRIKKPMAHKGIRQLHAAVLRAFCKARACAPGTGLLSSSYLTKLRDFEEVVRMSFDVKLTAGWEQHARSWLVAKGYSGDQSREYTETVKEHTRFLRRHAFLYEQAHSCHEKSF